MQDVQGINHITAIASDPQRNINFYHHLLGQRLVKKTVNFDDSGTYHFYFADETGTPGFLYDERQAELGTNLKLPPWLESRRIEIESRLPPVKITNKGDIYE